MKGLGLLAIAGLLASTPAQAWNDKGHMTVAAVAWSTMSDQTKAAASRLLRLNPNYQDWVRDVPADQRDIVAFVRAATWPDKIRSSYEDDGYDPVEPRASQNFGYADHLVHRYWHFKDLPFSPDGSATPQPPAVNAVSRIELFRRALGDPAASDNVKSYDLAWLLHLVGDIHQPLHATERFTNFLLGGDSGGNSVKVCTVQASYCGTDNSLHSFWDGAVGNSPNASAAIAKARQLAPADGAAAAIDDPNTWADESFRLAQRYVYAAPIGLAKRPYRLTTQYQTNAGSVAEKRIALAGARLGLLLEQALR